MKKSADFKKFKTVKQSDTHTLLQHDDGHQVLLSHNKLSDAQQRQLQKLPKYSDGGGIKNNDGSSALDDIETVVGSNNDAETSDGTTAADNVLPNKMVRPGAAGLHSDPDIEPDAPTQQTAAPTPEPAVDSTVSAPSLQLPEQQPQQDQPFGTSSFDSVFKKQEQAVATQQQSANAQIAAQQNAAVAQAKALDDAEMHIGHVRSQQATLAEDVNGEIQNGVIDPNHYYHNLSTAGKISTAIGLILGGFGAAATGGKNLAVGVLENAIDRDIKGQVATKQYKENMVGALSHLYKDEEMGALAAKDIQLAKAQASLQTELNRPNGANSLAAAASAQQAMAHIAESREAIARQMGVLSYAKSVPAEQNAHAIGALVQVNPALKQFASKALEENDKILQTHALATQAETVMNKLQELTFAGTRKFNTKAEYDAMVSGLIVEVQKKVAGRFNKEENDLLTRSFTAPSMFEAISGRSQKLFDTQKEALKNTILRFAPTGQNLRAMGLTPPVYHSPIFAQPKRK